jgi:hypothetical protein
LARLILLNPQRAVREHVRVRRTLAAEEVSRYRELTSDFLDSWATNSDARAAVARLNAGES